MSRSFYANPSTPHLFDAEVLRNRQICDEHRLLVLSGVNMRDASPGQFLHLAPANIAEQRASTPVEEPSPSHSTGVQGTSWAPVPLLRRAFSIAGMRLAANDWSEMDVIYRVVGTATRWMARLAPGELVSAIGPLGNSFPISPTKRHAWMVAGGVGLPPTLWLAERLHAAGKESVAFVGARRAALLPLAVEDPGGVARDGRSATLSATEFARWSTPVVISTDDGSLGRRGYIPDALKEYARANEVPDNDLVVYTCGPEPMMQAVAQFCLEHAIECYTCLERAMACGTGTCQSCAVAVRDATYDDGWRYALCCTEGPVFEAARVIWADDPTQVVG